MSEQPRDFDQIHRRFLDMAETAGKQSNCVRRNVGAVVVVGGEAVTTGFNGPGREINNCVAAGCPRCIDGGNTGEGYDRCICVHAEQRAIASAAKAGVALNGAILYVNLRPCLSCLLLALEAGITDVVYSQAWKYSDEGVESAYLTLTKIFTSFSCPTIDRTRSDESSTKTNSL